MLKKAQYRAGQNLPSYSGGFGCASLPAYAPSRWARTLCGCGLLISSLSTTSCLFQKQHRVFVPPVIAKAPPPPPVTPIPIVLPDDPEISPDIPSRPHVDLPTVSELPNLPVAPPPKAAVVKPTRTVEPPPVVVEIPPVQPPPAVPVQLLTVEERRVYLTSFDAAMERVKNALARVEGRNLNAEQRNIANRVRTFQSQAEQMKTQDLVTAVNLANNADLLARDLLRRLN